jgi:hypothetical protein
MHASAYSGPRLSRRDFSFMVEPVSWDHLFSEPIELPKGKKLVTLRNAALYITEFSKG